jgi:hypothetical protein
MDEMGFSQQSIVPRFRAPKGQTPLPHGQERPDRLSVIRPSRRFLQLYFNIHDHNTRTNAFKRFVRRVPRRGRGSIILAAHQ